MACDYDLERTVSLLVQAAAFIELEAMELRNPQPRDKAQRVRIANVNSSLAQTIRNHIATLQPHIGG